MTRDDWRELAYWCSFAGAFLIYVVLAHVVTMHALALFG